MSAIPSCIVHEFPIPDREYCAAAPAQWDRPLSRARRPAPSRVRRQRRPRLLPLALAGLTLFSCGFLLGHSSAIGETSPASEPVSHQFSLLPEEPEANGSDPVRILGVPGAVTGSGETALSDSKEDWNLILINGDHLLPKDFHIPELTQLRNGHAIDSRAYPDLQRMMDAARAEGLEPLICSSYRSWDKQSELFENKVQSCMAQSGSLQDAEKQAAIWVAPPGASEHQAGLAVDIVDKSYQLLDEGQEETAVQQWLMAHCAEYGFILRYPTEKSALTGVGYEPWHYRYVGVEAAREIMNQGLCLEEYLAVG